MLMTETEYHSRFRFHLHEPGGGTGALTLYLLQAGDL